MNRLLTAICTSAILGAGFCRAQRGGAQFKFAEPLRFVRRGSRWRRRGREAWWGTTPSPLVKPDEQRNSDGGAIAIAPQNDKEGQSDEYIRER